MTTVPRLSSSEVGVAVMHRGCFFPLPVRRYAFPLRVFGRDDSSPPGGSLHRCGLGQRGGGPSAGRLHLSTCGHRRRDALESVGSRDCTLKTKRWTGVASIQIGKWTIPDRNASSQARFFFSRVFGGMKCYLLGVKHSFTVTQRRSGAALPSLSKSAVL